jgi:hypothetical protein
VIVQKRLSSPPIWKIITLSIVSQIFFVYR